MRNDEPVTPQHEAPRVLADLSRVPLSLDAAVEAVSHPRAGAIAVFIGTVRDHDGGRDGVERLDYSAHPDAGAALTELAGRIAADHDVLAVAAVHRTGELAVGDTAVVCAVSAEHRAEAFAACRELIEQLKAGVPIWKRQRFDSGDTQWVGL